MSQRQGEPGSEFELIELMRERIAAAGAGAGPRLIIGSGDDAAITQPAGATATSVDAIVDGVHFTRSTFPPDAIGHKALAAALSDLAACGAEPGEAYVQLGVPADLSPLEVGAIADGMARCAAESGTVIAGGDVVAAPVLFLAVTVVGHAASAGEFVPRSGACPGDAVVVTGSIGGAAAGISLAARGSAAAAKFDQVEWAAGLAERQLRPIPRIAAGLILARAGSSAMIDISDGLAADAGHVARSSRVGLELDGALIPIQEGVAEVAGMLGADPLAFAVSGGEDYELLACLPADRTEIAAGEIAASGGILTVIGRVLEPRGSADVTISGLAASAAPGFDQLQGRFGQD